ncbi:MBL fold metallo-hydrolase [Pseudomonas sp. GD03842]|uniref:MBL fold metallo-hydrolase n=1 Tax=Pseudomonas sp. GD03842 TaxID=2975385 RepID=UPI0024498E2E|nr:MBL fold metallo-hydrolase [Pseudomonas sp. GD03842]MDH0748212.1 MBL fold metallo-hydrolase [Pseudomonas sp. GD03842]
MKYPEVIHHGAGDGVTGSCHELRVCADHRLLIDCGVFQGEEAALIGRLCGSASAIDFDVSLLKLLIITHVHADHIGRIPELLASGFKGPILCSEPSAKLLPVMLEDSLRLNPRYDSQSIERCLKQVERRIIALPFDTWFDVIKAPEAHCRVRLQRAGHVLGSAYVECDLIYTHTEAPYRVVFSGDLGSSHMPILPEPRSPERADLLVLESTYGDRLHEDRATRQARLEAVIDRALLDHGTVLIPAFSIGRTQELLYEIEDILHQRALSCRVEDGCDASLPVNWPQLPVILDSPLAEQMTRIYQAFDELWDEEGAARVKEGRKPLGFRQLITVDTHAKHLQVVNYLASTGRPAIVIAGHGMCAGGRVVNYLKAMLGDPRHNVVFVGYQAKGTPGAAIQKYGAVGGYVELDKERYPIKAGIETLGGYSAHADQHELVKFVTGMAQWPARIRLVHGESEARKKLGQVLERQYRAQSKTVHIE